MTRYCTSVWMDAADLVRQGHRAAITAAVLPSVVLTRC
jgi:hypothetical protein